MFIEEWLQVGFPGSKLCDRYLHAGVSLLKIKTCEGVKETGLDRRRSWIVVKSQLRLLLILDPMDSSETGWIFTSEEKPSDGGREGGPFVSPPPSTDQFLNKALFSEGISKRVTQLHGVDGLGDVGQHSLKNLLCICSGSPLALANYREHITDIQTLTYPLYPSPNI